MIADLGLIELLYLLLEHDENGVGRLAGLELSSEWVGKKIVFCLSLVSSQGIVENVLEVGARGP